MWEVERSDRGETLAQAFARAAAAASMDVVPFLKASLWCSSPLLRAPGENPRSSHRAVAALCVVLFLKTPPWSLRWAALRRLVTSGKACILIYTTGVSCWMNLVCLSELVIPWWLLRLTSARVSAVCSVCW